MALSSSVEKVLRPVEEKTGLPVHFEVTYAICGLTPAEIELVEEARP